MGFGCESACLPPARGDAHYFGSGSGLERTLLLAVVSALLVFRSHSESLPGRLQIAFVLHANNAFRNVFLRLVVVF